MCVCVQCNTYKHFNKSRFFCLLNSGNQHWKREEKNQQQQSTQKTYWPLCLQFFALFPSFIWFNRMWLWLLASWHYYIFFVLYYVFIQRYCVNVKLYVMSLSIARLWCCYWHASQVFFIVMKLVKHLLFVIPRLKLILTILKPSIGRQIRLSLQVGNDVIQNVSNRCMKTVICC